MPSPFPGMDPFLEAHWGDVHTSLTTYARDQLRPQLPRDLTARIEESVHLDTGGESDSRVIPDVRVVERTSPVPERGVHDTNVGLAATPVLVPMSEEWTERWINIHDREQNRLVTVLEFLSPGNKQSPRQRETFRAKQDLLLSSGVNLVEIDLIRDGGWTVAAPAAWIPDHCAYPYRICVVRPEKIHVECYPTKLQQPLPTIRIPLRVGEPDVTLDLQQLIDLAWDRGDYAGIDYSNAPRPTFRPADEAWIEQKIAAWKTATS